MTTKPIYGDICYGPLRCPDWERWPGDIIGCGSVNVGEPEDDGIVDCFDCGIFFAWEEGGGAEVDDDAPALAYA